jgi:hypothetical protein
MEKIDEEVSEVSPQIARLLQQICEHQETYNILYERNVLLASELADVNRRFAGLCAHLISGERATHIPGLP